jgi:hypothetical protein
MDYHAWNDADDGKDRHQEQKSVIEGLLDRAAEVDALRLGLLVDSIPIRIGHRTGPG